MCDEILDFKRIASIGIGLLLLPTVFIGFATAGDPAMVWQMPAARMSAIASGPAPSLAYIAPAPELSKAARKLLSGAGETALFGKWRANPEALIQAMGAEESEAAKSGMAALQTASLIQTLPTVNNRTFDSTFAFTESETTVAQPLANDVVVGFKSSADFALGGSFSGYAVSVNGGRSFNEVKFGLPAAGAIIPTGDPSLAADGSGNVYCSTLGMDFGTGDSHILVYESIDGGQTFAPTEIINTDPGVFLDKSLTTVDTNPASPHHGNIYTTLTKFSAAPTSPIFVCTSPAGTCVAVVNESASGAMPAVGPNGELYVAWEQFSTGGGMNPIDALYFSVSLDGGATFSTPTFITNVSPIFDSGVTSNVCMRPALKGGIRVNDFPSIAVDTGAKSRNKGAIYVVWNDQINGDPDIFITKSTNGGASWQSPVMVNKNGAGTDQFFPWITVLPNGKIGVTYYDRSRDRNNWYMDYDLAVSSNGGAALTQSFLTRRPFPVVVNTDAETAACYMSDYNQISNNGLNLLLPWGDNSNGDPDMMFAKR